MNKDKKSKNKYKKIYIIFIIIGLFLIGLGFVLGNDKEKTNYKENNSNNNTEKNKQVKYKEFNKYNNFKLKQIKTLDNYILMYEAEIDINNKIAKLKLEKEDIIKYIYFDFNTSTSYISDDNKTWYKKTFTNTKLPDYTEIIDKVISISPYVMDNKKIISLKTTARLGGNVYNNVLTDVIFDKEGYIKRIQYDFSSLYNNTLSYTIDYRISDINMLEKIIIPNNVISSATKHGQSIVVDF